MRGHRRGHSYRRYRPRIMIANPTVHKLRGEINQLRREIEQAREIAARFQIDPTGIGQKQQALARLEKQLEGISQ